MPALIHANLFRPPAFPYPYVSREALVTRIKSENSARVIVVEAPGGYGKSLGMAEFIEHTSAPAAWYPLEHLPAQTRLVFLGNLVQSVRAIWPAFGEQSLALLARLAQVENQLSDDDWLFSALLPMFVKELAGLGQPLWLVFDNYHLLSASAGFDAVLFYLFEHAPQTARFIIISREPFDWSQRVAWQADGRLMVVDEALLSLSEAEVQSLTLKLGVPLLSEQSAAVRSRLGGQLFLHNLLARTCRQKSEVEVAEILSVLMDPAQPVTDALVSHSLRAETLASRDFLLRTSVLPILDPIACNALLGINDSSTFLQHLGSQFFIRPLESDGERPMYVHGHEILRAFFHQALIEEYDAAEVKQLYGRLGQIYAERGDLDQAISTLCRGEHYAAASDLVYEQARQLVSAVQLPRLANWLKCFPPEWIENDPALLLYRGILLSSKSAMLARESFQRAGLLYRQRQNLAGAAWALIEHGWLDYQNGSYASARALLEEALRGPEQSQVGNDLLPAVTALPPRLHARGLHYLAVTLHGADDFERALSCAAEAVDILRGLDTYEDQAALTRLFRHLSQIHESVGQVREGYDLISEAHQLAAELDLGDLALAWLDNSWAMGCLFLNRLDEAHAHLDEAERLIEPYRALHLGLPLFDYIHLTRGEVYMEAGDVERAEALFRQSADNVTDEMVRLYLSLPGRELEAQDLAQQLWRSRQNHKSPVYRAKGDAYLGIAALQVADLPRAQTLLESAAAVLEHYGADHALISVRLYLGWLYHQLDQPARAQTNLGYVFKQMSQRGQDTLFIWQPRAVAEMCAFALRHSIEVDYVERLAIKRLSAAQAGSFIPLLNDPVEDVRERAARILRGLGSALQVESRQRLSACRDKLIRARLLAWMDAGWLTDSGLVRLSQALSWRQVEIFLLWISPQLCGRTERIAGEANITVDTVNTHLKDCCRLLNDNLNAQLPRGKGAYMAAYDWAIHAGLVNPLAM